MAHRLFESLFVASLVALTALGCASDTTPEGAPAAEQAPAVEPALSRVTADRADLLFRYRSEDSFHSATAIDEIPADARGAVQVVDLALSPEARRSTRVVQIFDLRTPGPGGAFPGRFVPRGQLESALAEAQAVPVQAAVTMYSASWCGVCNKARSFMTQNGIAFVEKDIEKDKGAAAELGRKARAAGVDASGVPVFDVGGTLMPGFDGARLMALVRGG